MVVFITFDGMNNLGSQTTHLFSGLESLSTYRAVDKGPRPKQKFVSQALTLSQMRENTQKGFAASGSVHAT